MSVEAAIWSATDTAIAVSAHVSGGSQIRLMVYADSACTDLAGQSAQEAVSASLNAHMQRVAVTGGLEAGTSYWLRIAIDGVEDTAYTIAGYTLPAAGAAWSGRLGLGNCARLDTNNDVFTRIAARGASQGGPPHLFIHAGDWHYKDGQETDPTFYIDGFIRSVVGEHPEALWQAVPAIYTPDDHGNPDNASDATDLGRAAAQESYRRAFPHLDLATAPDALTGALYFNRTVGRISIIGMDLRSERYPDQDEMISATQMQWVKDEIAAAVASGGCYLLVSTVPPLTEENASGDDWSAFTAQREALWNWITSNGHDASGAWLSGDMHGAAYDDGTNNYYATGGLGAGMPLCHAGALHRGGSTKGGPYLRGAFEGKGQYGLLDVVDTGGESITIRFRAFDAADAALIDETFALQAQPTETETGIEADSVQDNGDGTYTFTWNEAPLADDYTLTVEASDSGGRTGSDSEALTVEAPPPAPDTVPADSAVDNQDGTYTFTWDAAPLADDYTLTVEAADTAGNTASDSEPVTVEAPPASEDTNPPSITLPLGLPTPTEGEAFDVVCEISDAEGNLVTPVASDCLLQGVDGADSVVDDGAGTYTFSFHAAPAAGSYTVEVTASDTQGNDASLTALMTVRSSQGGLLQREVPTLQALRDVTTALQTDYLVRLAGKSDDAHLHDERYYTEVEIDVLLGGKSDDGHTHVEADILDLDKYTQAQVDGLLGGKADTGHLHDDRYYTEAETDALLAGLPASNEIPADSVTDNGDGTYTFTWHAAPWAGDYTLEVEAEDAGGRAVAAGAPALVEQHTHVEYLTNAEHAALDADSHASGGATDGHVLTADGAGGAAWETLPDGPDGVTDHGLLNGLGDDDHPQYFNEARGDARYYTETEIDSFLSGKADSGHTHSLDALSDVSVPTPADGDALKWNAGSSQWQAAALSDGGGGVTDHGALTGLGDDDHTHYALADGTRGDFAALGHKHAITDIERSGASDGDIIVWNEALTRWVVLPPPSGGGDYTDADVKDYIESGTGFIQPGGNWTWTSSFGVEADTLRARGYLMSQLGKIDLDGFEVSLNAGNTRLRFDGQEMPIMSDLHAQSHALFSPDHADVNHGATPQDGEVLLYDASLAMWKPGPPPPGDGGGTTDHGALTGLGDDDHSQYALADGTEQIGGNWSFEAWPVKVGFLSAGPALDLYPDRMEATIDGGALLADIKFIDDASGPLVHLNTKSLKVNDPTLLQTVFEIDDGGATRAHQQLFEEETKRVATREWVNDNVDFPGDPAAGQLVVNPAVRSEDGGGLGGGDHAPWDLAVFNVEPATAFHTEFSDFTRVTWGNDSDQVTQAPAWGQHLQIPSGARFLLEYKIAVITNTTGETLKFGVFYNREAANWDTVVSQTIPDTGGPHEGSVSFIHHKHGEGMIVGTDVTTLHPGEDMVFNVYYVRITPQPFVYKPEADFIYADDGLAVNFFDQSDPAYGDIIAWEWGFGDGDASTQQNPSHTYASANTYSVTLTVTDSEGATDSITNDVTVAENFPPTAGFNWSPSGLVIDFTDESTDADGTVGSWSWDFGDGNTSTQQNPSHTYASEGSYNVTLTVTDDDGATDSHSEFVTTGLGEG